MWSWPTKSVSAFGRRLISARASAGEAVGINGESVDVATDESAGSVMQNLR